MFDENEWTPTSHLRWNWWRLEQMWKRPVTGKYGYIERFESEWRRIPKIDVGF